MISIVFIWTGVTSYMADCWRALAAQPDVRVKIIIEQRRASRETAFDAATVLRGLDATVVFDDEPLDKDGWRERLVAFEPDAFFIVGWHATTSRFFAEESAWQKVPKVLIFDLPFAWTIRKILAPIILHRYLKRFIAAFVPGKRAARYARWLGFASDHIEQGLFSIQLPSKAEFNKPTGGFLYVGRYVSEKRLDVLLAAYQKYRKLVAKPWPLTCCGMGPEAGRLAGVEGVSNCGFLQPEGVSALYAESRAFVLASDFDPWPLVILESVAHGLPVICTEACGNSNELVKQNGIVCRTNNVDSLAKAMVRMTANEGRLAEMGRQGIALAKPYGCEAWAARTRRIAEGMISAE